MRFVTILLCALSISALGACADLIASGSGLELIEKATQKGEEIEDVTLGNAVKVLPPYCTNVPAVARAVFRDRVNARPEAGGAQIGIYCPGDPPLVLGP